MDATDMLIPLPVWFYIFISPVRVGSCAFFFFKYICTHSLAILVFDFLLCTIFIGSIDLYHIYLKNGIWDFFFLCSVCLYILSHVEFFVTPWIIARQAHLSMGFSRQEYWSGLPFPSPGHLPDPGVEPRSPALQADSLSSELQRVPKLCGATKK